MIQHIAAMIVRYRLFFLILALILLIPTIYGMQKLKVEYDLLNYLPKDLKSVQGIHILNKQFGFSSTANIVVRNSHDWEALALKDRIQRIEGVSTVYWLTDIADYTVPREYQRHLVDQFYREDATILQVQFSAGSSSPITRAALKEIKQLLNDGQDIIGAMVTTAEMQEQSENEKLPMLLTSLAIITFVLLLTLPSFLTPVLFLITLGFSVVWNLGLAYFLGGRISYLTNSVAAALQLGVTMDYCIFLLHRFEEEMTGNVTVEQAMVKAVSRTMVAILASSLTTVAGFATLGLMQVQIGADLGLTMARGVLISVFATTTVLPSLLIVTMPLLEKLRHRPLLPSFAGLGRFVAKFHIPLVLVLILVAVPAWYGRANLEVSFDLEKSFPESLPSMKALKTLRERYDIADTANVITRNVPEWKNLDLDRQIAGIDGIRGTSSYLGMVGPGVPEQFVPQAVKNRYLAEDYYNIYLTLDERAAHPLSGHAFEETRRLIGETGEEVYLTGQTVVDHDMRELSKQDMKQIDRLTVVAIALIVALTFGSLSIPVLLVLIIQVAIWINQSLVFYAGNSLYFFASLALATIQLGSTVDYAILVTSRFREERAHYPAKVAIARAVNETAGALITSGLTLCGATFGIYLISSLTLVKDLALLLARGAIISMVAASVLLPAALLVMDKIFAVTTLKWPTRSKKTA